MSLSPIQHEIRRLGITATDVPAIVGMHPFRAPIEVWLEKTAAEHVEVDIGDRGKWGNLLEGPIRDDYADRHKVIVRRPGTLVHTRYEHHIATPDGLVFNHGEAHADRGLEIKTHTLWLRDKYGDAGTDQVPAHELLQCAWNMHVTGLDRWDLVVFMDNLPTDYRLHRDLELEDMLVRAVDRFWTRHVLAGVPPEPDGSEQYGAWLERRHPRNTAGQEVVADPQQEEMVAELRQLVAEQKRLEARQEHIKQQLQAAIGDAEAIRSGDDVITWKLPKQTFDTDWRAVAYALGQGRAEELNAAVELHTKAKKNSRRFCVPRKWHQKKDKK